MNLRFSGAYKVRVLRLDGSVRLETDFFDNLITNTGLDWLGAYINTPVAWVSNGTTPPSNNSTSMSGTILGFKNNRTESSAVQVSTLPNYGYTNYTYTFDVGGVVGDISELGIGAGTVSTITYLFSRALIVNNLGVPITITLTSTDQLQIVYQLRQYMPDGDTTFDLDVNGVTHTFTVRPSYNAIAQYWTPYITRIQFYDDGSWVCGLTGAIGPRSGAPSGTIIPSTTRTMSTYVLGSYVRGFVITWLPAAGTRTFASFLMRSLYTAAGTWQFGVTPSIVKTDLQSLRIEGQYSWGRYA